MQQLPDEPLIKIWKFEDAPPWARCLYGGPGVPRWVMQVAGDLVDTIDELLERTPENTIEVHRYSKGNTSAVYIGMTSMPAQLLSASYRNADGFAQGRP